MRHLLKIFIFFLIFIIALSACVAQKNPVYKKRKKKEIVIETTKLGKNKLFFSKQYQRKLQKNMKRKKR